MSSHERRTSACFISHRTAGLAGIIASAILLSPLVAAADPAPNPAHTIANRFAEDAKRAEAQRKEVARKQAQQRQEQAARVAKAKAQKAHEAEMLARARAEAEERRQLEAAASRLDAIRAEREAREAEAERQRAEKARLIEASRQAEEARVAAEARKAQEKAEEMQRAAEALRVATERAAAEEARKAEEARIAEEARKAEEARRIEQARLAEAARQAEAERAAAEARRAEQAAWAAEEAKRVEQARKAEEIRQANEALRIAAERAEAEKVARAEAEQRAAEARREIERATAAEARRIADLEADAEVARVAERLRRIRDEQLTRHTGAVESTEKAAAEERTHEPTSGRGRIVENEGFGDVPLAPAQPRTADTYRDDESLKAPTYSFDGHVTVILQMEPRYRRGRRYESMDPVLCTAGGCYVSNGPDQPATFMYGRGATRFGNAIGRRAGACNGDTTCVFRGIDIGALPADLQPVDIRVLRHDRRTPERVHTLSSCRTEAGTRLQCAGAIEGDGYTMWVIAEDAAERLPPHAFDGALAGGFTDQARVEADMIPMRGRW